jgi:hypothetical protein
MTQTKLAPLLLACLALALPASAAEPPHDAAGVTVTGSGEVMVRPDTMELELQAAADAELTGDATTKYEYGIGGAKKTESRLTSQSLEEIPVRVSLRVRFAVEEKVDEQ